MQRKLCTYLPKKTSKNKQMEKKIGHQKRFGSLNWRLKEFADEMRILMDS